jgi:hypothetical protein
MFFEAGIPTKFFFKHRALGLGWGLKQLTLLSKLSLECYTTVPTTLKKFSIQMLLPMEFLPGFAFNFECVWPDESNEVYFSMDLPNMIGKLCEKGPMLKCYGKDLLWKIGLWLKNTILRKFGISYMQ